MIRNALFTAAIALLSADPRVILLEDGFLPKNNLQIRAGAREAKGITQEQFDQVMDRAEAIYGPEIAARGGRLVLRRLWENPTVNASAQRSGTDYILNMYGGLARHESITQDGMALVVCHEIGHHIGGAPKYDGGLDWASNEGQADYFANLKCLRLMFAGEGASFTRPKNDDPGPRAACEHSFALSVDQDLCVRGAIAGMSVTTLFRQLRQETTLPRYDTPDPAVVAEMYDGHPGTQCRLDTYFAGSLCARAVDERLDETDPAPGACTAASGHFLGLRPLCWYKPDGVPDPAVARAAMDARPKTPALTSALRDPELWRGL
jgi:hypothetical protein